MISLHLYYKINFQALDFNEQAYSPAASNFPGLKPEETDTMDQEVFSNEHSLLLSDRYSTTNHPVMKPKTSQQHNGPNNTFFNNVSSF